MCNMLDVRNKQSGVESTLLNLNKHTLQLIKLKLKLNLQIHRKSVVFNIFLLIWLI